MGVNYRVNKPFSKTERYLIKLLHVFKKSSLDKYGKAGVELLKENTPTDTGLTAESWDYVVDISDDVIKIVWTNSNVAEDMTAPVAVIIQEGHASKNGAWVEGVDYINPALKPLFDKIAKDMWEEVCRVDG